MRRFVKAAAAFALLGSFGAAADLPKPPTKPGLWQMEKHTNLAIFIAPAASAADAAKRSEQVLAGPGMKLLACLTPELLQKHFDITSSGIGCTVGAPQHSGDAVTVDSVCHERKIHTIYRLAPDGSVASMTSIRLGGPTTQRSEVRFNSPEHLTVEVSMNAPGEQGVPILDRWDFRWLSADCQGLALDEFKPLTDKPETRR
jgi:hypothetical protein